MTTSPKVHGKTLKQLAEEVITSLDQEPLGAAGAHDKALAPHEDIMGTRLWDYIQPLTHQVGAVLYYVWRADLHPTESAEWEYKKALNNLKMLNPNAAIEAPYGFFETYQFKKLYEGGEALAIYGVGQAKANMLHHYTRMLKHPCIPESTQYFYQRQNHYYALRNALEEAI